MSSGDVELRVIRKPTSTRATRATPSLAAFDFKIDLNECNTADPTETPPIPDAYVASWKRLLKDQLFWARISIFFLTMFLSILSVFYSISQILTLTVSNYWCPQRDLQEIREHSYIHNLPKGDEDNGCWSAKEYTVNLNALWSTASYGYEAHTTVESIMKNIAFSLVVIAFIICMIYALITLITDIKMYFNITLGLAYFKKELYEYQHNATKVSTNSGNILQSVYEMYRSRYYADSGLWCLSAICRETLELLLQTQALLLYNGAYLFKNNEQNVSLAYGHEYITLFAVFLFLNCILSGILWLFYAFKPVFCHGLIFELFLYILDAVFDIFYTIFPLIIVFSTTDGSNTSSLVALASLQTDTQLAFWATFVPIMFLLVKCWYLLTKSTNAMRYKYAEKYMKKYIQIMDAEKRVRTSSVLHKIIPQTITSKQKTVNWVISKHNTIPSATASLSDVLMNIPKKPCHHSYIRKFIISIVSIVFIIYGIYVLSSVLSHFNYATQYCNILVDEQYKFVHTFHENDTYTFSTDIEQLLHQDSELFWWEYCEYKVYPFDLKGGGNNVCQCRNFRMDFASDDIKWNAAETLEYFGLNLVKSCMNMFKSWYMLEKVGIMNIKESYLEIGEPPMFNFTQNMFNARKLKVLHIQETPISYIDDMISNWKDLVYFVLIRSEVSSLPNTFQELTNIEYFEFGQSVGAVTEFPVQICEFTKLKALKMNLNSMKSLPHCIVELGELESILLAQNLFENIPIGLFAMPSLKELNLELTEVTLKNLITYNNITLNEFDSVFKYNDDTHYMFQQSQFCLEYDGIIPPSSTFPKTFLNFINNTGCCVSPCDSIFKSPKCYSSIWQDGVCDDACNTYGCAFDGGDCLQLCECDYKLLVNNECNPECNNTNCEFDKGDCSDTHALCLTEYSITHNCNPEWIDDGWCDEECQHLTICNYDGNDCGEHSCDEGTNCESMYWLFELVANSITNDNKVSEDEFCKVWPFLLSLYPGSILQNNTDCTFVWGQLDANNDDIVNFDEMISIYGEQIVALPSEKVHQLNCSVCIDGK